MDDGIPLPLSLAVSSTDDSDEAIIREAPGLWRENPYAESRDDGQGWLVLTTGHIQFATDRLGAILDMPLNAYESAEVKEQRNGKTMLVLHYRDGESISFWTDQELAFQVGNAVVEAARQR